MINLKKKMASLILNHIVFGPFLAGKKAGRGTARGRRLSFAIIQQTEGRCRSATHTTWEAPYEPGAAFFVFLSPEKFQPAAAASGKRAAH